MNISSVSTVGAIQPGATARPREGGPFEAVSDLLGMSADEIATAVSSGSSLLELAESRSVSSEDLYSALEAGAPPDLQGAENLREIVTHIAQQSGPTGGPGGPPPGPPPGGPGAARTPEQDQTLDALGALLDMTGEELSTELASGTGLAALLEQRGVSFEELATALQEGLAGTATGSVVDVSC